jgi:hypothetical protein
MNISEQQELRANVSELMLAWADSRHPPFTGESREGFEEAILAAHLIADEGRLVLHRWVDAARRSGLSWSEIGDTLGISKQAAQQRFRNPADSDVEPSLSDGGQIIRYWATAFNEMRILREEGEKGHELVAVAALALVFRRTDQQWEYRRVISSAAAVGRMEHDGWTYVASWLPFLYFKRPVV